MNVMTVAWNISLSTVVYAGYPDIHLNADELLRHVVATGFRSIEVSAWNLLEDWPLKELVARCKAAGISIPSVHCTHHYDLDVIGRDYHQKPIGDRDSEEVFREFHEEFYNDLEGAGLNQVIVVEHLPTLEKQLDFALNRLSVLREVNNQFSFVIATENMPGPPRDEQLCVLRKLLAEEGIAYCHDINHAAMASFEPFDFVEFLPKLRNVHVVGNNPLIRFGDGVPPGLGIVPIPQVLRKMIESGYSGPLTVEIYGFERELDTVFRMGETALTVVDPERGRQCGTALAGSDWRDIMAIYSRKYLERVIESKGDHYE